MPDDVIRLSLFSFSLSGEAKRWLHSFKGNSLKTWDEVVEKFLKKYFPESKTTEGKIAISSFHQFLDESLSEALERFCGLLRNTPTHGFSELIQLNIFIDGLRPQSKQLLDVFALVLRICEWVSFSIDHKIFLRPHSGIHLEIGEKKRWLLFLL